MTSASPVATPFSHAATPPSPATSPSQAPSPVATPAATPPSPVAVPVHYHSTQLPVQVSLVHVPQPDGTLISTTMASSSSEVASPATTPHNLLTSTPATPPALCQPDFTSWSPTALLQLGLSAHTPDSTEMAALIGEDDSSEAEDTCGIESARLTAVKKSLTDSYPNLKVDRLSTPIFRPL